MINYIKCLNCCFYRKRRSAKSRPSIINPSSCNIIRAPPLLEGYDIQYEIGKGKYGKVYKVTRDGVTYAIKQMVRSNTKIVYIEREIETMVLLSSRPHSNIINYHHNIRLRDYDNLVLEYCPGRDLFDEIVKRQYFTENDSIPIMKQLFSGVSHLHKLGIMHRDIKPENIMYINDTHIKIIDFGLSCFFDRKNDTPRHLSRVGTSYYISPEVLNKYYTSSCDEWSLGVILYILLCGSPPFNGGGGGCGGDEIEIIRAIKKGTLEFTNSKWLQVSDKATFIISSLLNKNYKKRIRSDQCLKLDWFKDIELSLGI
jgi:calcium-dependent protein kinase